MLSRLSDEILIRLISSMSYEFVAPDQRSASVHKNVAAKLFRNLEEGHDDESKQCAMTIVKLVYEPETGHSGDLEFLVQESRDIVDAIEKGVYSWNGRNKKRKSVGGPKIRELETDSYKCIEGFLGKPNFKQSKILKAVKLLVFIYPELYAQVAQVFLSGSKPYEPVKNGDKKLSVKVDLDKGPVKNKITVGGNVQRDVVSGNQGVLLRQLTKEDYLNEDLINEWMIYEVAFLWHGFEPPTAAVHVYLMTRPVERTKRMLHDAVDQKRIAVTREDKFPDGVTRYLSRDELLKFTLVLNLKPAFLYPEVR